MSEIEALPDWLERESIGVIDKIELLTVSLPFVAPFGTSVAVWNCKEALLIRMEDNGIIAWGECVADPDPYYASETTSTARHILKDFLFPELKPGLTLAALLRRCARVRGHQMAKAALENALLDLLAKRRGLPLHALLGFPTRRVMSGISIGIQETIAKLLEKVEEAVAAGYHRVKMKIQHGQDVEWVKAVRKRFPDLALMADANGDYTLADAAHLARLDESIHDTADAEAAIALKSCQVINIKQGRVGGVLEAVKMARLCAANGIPAWSGGMDETGIGRALNIQLQTAPGFTLPGDTSETSRYFHEDIIEPGVVLAGDGFIEVPPGPGSGVKVVPERLERYLLDRELVG